LPGSGGGLVTVPEGDTIWRTAAALRQRLVGRTVRRSSHTGLEERKVEGVEPVGKHLLIRFEGGWVLRTHMGMSGTWHLYRPGERWRKPAWRVRALLECEDVVAVCFSAPVVQLTRDPRLSLAHLGPDILAPDLELGQVVRRARQLGDVPLGELLLDQRVCCGIGNVYRCEALWARRLDPWESSGRMSDDDLMALFAQAREAMLANLGGGVGRRFPGYGRPAVHGRRGHPCPRCGTAVASRQQGEHARWTYFCPRCQPRADRQA
jgi:endonuclease-8